MIEEASLPPAEQKAEYVPYDERWTIAEGYQIKVKATVTDAGRKIHRHNQSRGFTSVLFIGESGSGKTTLRQDVIHDLHQRHPYVLKFFYEEEILRLKEIIYQLPKYHDYILAFDDVSFLVKKGVMKEDELMSMFHELTKVRHTVRGNVVAMFTIHYPYAIEKFLRQAAYRFLTSVSDDEREIYVKLYGPQSRGIIEQFIQDDRYQTEEGRFYLPDVKGKMIPFDTKNPFKIALASRMGDLTYMVYGRVSCSVCTEPKDRKHGFDKNWILQQRQKYGEKTFLRVTKWFGFINLGVSVLGKNDRALYNAWVKYAQESSIDVKELVELLKDVRAAPKEEREDYFLKRLVELEEKARNKKEEVLPDQVLEKDANQEPDIEEAENNQDDDEDDDSDLFDGINFGFGEDGN